MGSDGAAQALRGKSILVVGRDYYFYTREIASELRTGFGAAVVFYPIEPANVLYRLLKKCGVSVAWWLRHYHRKIISGFGLKVPDLVLFIQVHQIGDLIQTYREAFVHSRFVLYYWDSIKTHDYRPYAMYFDRICTFDPVDAKEHPPFKYLPLFFTERFRSLRGIRNIVWDASFVGVAVTDRRYDELVKLRQWSRECAASLMDYVVVSPFLYFKLLIKGKLLRDVHFRSIGEARLLHIYGNSRCILDLPNNVQTGYSMRTFEALGAHRKLITANRHIVDEDFYTRESVFVLGLDGEAPDRSFLLSPGKFSAAVELYYLHEWVIRLLGLDE